MGRRSVIFHFMDKEVVGMVIREFPPIMAMFRTMMGGYCWVVVKSIDPLCVSAGYAGPPLLRV